MKHTLTIDVINEKALKLLQDLEKLELIRIKKNEKGLSPVWPSHYKGAMTKQSVATIETELKELRNEWS